MEKIGELLERLVSDLPGLGGWPKWADECILHRGSCKAMFYDGSGRFQGYPSFPVIKFKEEALVERIVYKEMYEAALAASKPEWDGEGLPPVGCEFLFGTHQTKAKCIAVGRDVIFASTGDPDEKDGFYEEFVISIHHSEFRPIRSQADKKRAEGVIALSRVDPQAMPFEYGDKHSDGSLVGPFWYELYDAIAAGKIPHIRID